MPLKVDSLLTNSIVLNGTQLIGSKPIVGKINTETTYTSVGSTEVVIDSLLIPANTINGFMFPYYGVFLGCDTSSYSDLIIKVYVSPKMSIEGLTPFHQETINDLPSVTISSEFYESYGASPSLSNVNLLEFIGNKMNVLLNDGGLDPVYSTLSIDNFDVSKDLYIIVTAEKIGVTIGVTSLSMFLSTVGK